MLNSNRLQSHFADNPRDLPVTTPRQSIAHGQASGSLEERAQLHCAPNVEETERLQQFRSCRQEEKGVQEGGRARRRPQDQRSQAEVPQTTGRRTTGNIQTMTYTSFRWQERCAYSNC